MCYKLHLKYEFTKRGQNGFLSRIQSSAIKCPKGAVATVCHQHATNNRQFICLLTSSATQRNGKLSQGEGGSSERKGLALVYC